MIQINNINDKAFEIIGFGKTEVKSKVYTCEVQGTKLMLRNANDRDDILVEFLDYTLYTVDSATFASIDLLQAALVDVVFKAASGGSGAVWGEITGTLSTQTDVQNALNDKQEELLSGVNIKTVGGTSLLGNGDVPLNNDFTGLNDVPEGYTGSGGFAVQVNAGETGLEFVSSGGGGGGSQVMTFNFEGSHSSNSSTAYYSFRSKADGTLYNVGNIYSLSTYGNYRTSIIIPKDCFVKSIYMANVNSNSRSATETNLRLYKNGTSEYTGTRIQWTNNNPTYYGEWQITGLTSSDNSFSEGDIIDIAFNSNGTWGGTVCMITFETI